MSEDTCGELSPQLSTVAIQYRMAWMLVPLIRTEVRGLRNSFLGNNSSNIDLPTSDEGVRMSHYY